jgi:hypothetical protein
MKAIILAVVFGLSTWAFAEGPGDKFEEHKKQALENVDKRIKALQDHKSCISSAKDHKGMELCHEKMKEFHMDMREEHLKNRKDRIDERIKKLEDKKGEEKK